MYLMIHIGDEVPEDKQDALKQAIEDNLFKIDEMVAAELGDIVEEELKGDREDVWVEGIELITEE